jgi:hypothetical protein
VLDQRKRTKKQPQRNFSNEKETVTESKIPKGGLKDKTKMKTTSKTA